jgi:hypothetical protein
MEIDNQTVIQVLVREIERVVTAPYTPDLHVRDPLKETVEEKPDVDGNRDSIVMLSTLQIVPFVSGWIASHARCRFLQLCFLSSDRLRTSFWQDSVWTANSLPCPRLTDNAGSIETVRDAVLAREPALLDQSLHRAIENGNEEVSLLRQ